MVRKNASDLQEGQRPLPGMPRVAPPRGLTASPGKKKWAVLLLMTCVQRGVLPGAGGVWVCGRAGSCPAVVWVPLRAWSLGRDMAPSC